MRLPLAALLAGTLAACSGPSLTPGEAYERAQQATASGDGARAVRRLRDAAGDGHLWALHDLSGALDRGYVSGPWTDERVGSRNLPIRVWPGEAALRRRQYEEALRLGVTRGDTTASLLVAERLRLPHWDGEQWRDPTPARRDSARALLLPLATSGHVNALLLLSSIDGPLTAAGRAWTRRAAAAGGERGCWITFVAARLPWSGARALADRIDEAERCATLQPPRHPAADYAPDLLQRLRAEAGRGNPGAASLLDSLAAFGVYRAHPALADA